MATINHLSPTLINQIAAGEVIEKPASALKEIIENALDAEASHISIHIRDGGRTFIQVTDNGHGMEKDDLELYIQRHATSKLKEENLFYIKTLGFRGEALPSIGSVARLNIQSAHENSESGWEISVEGGLTQPARPIKKSTGTTVTIRDLFFAIPARLKFLKTNRSEYSACAEIVKRLALVNPHVRWTFQSEDKTVFDYPAQNQEERIQSVMGADFVQNSWKLTIEENQHTMVCWLGFPTFSRKQSSEQFFHINNRPVRNKLLSTTLRIAYNDVLENGRHPVGCVFINMPFDRVDVNAHPAKTEVRFEDSNGFQSWLIKSWRSGIQQHGKESSPFIAAQAESKFQSEAMYKAPLSHPQPSYSSRPSLGSFNPQPRNISTSFQQNAFLKKPPVSDTVKQAVMNSLEPDTIMPPMGYAKAQVFATYILASNEEELILIDQHAAHERIVYEKLKSEHTNLAKQHLIVPIICMYPEANQFATYDQEFLKVGLQCEWAGDRVVLRSIPAALINSSIDWQEFIQDMLDDIKNDHGSGNIDERIRAKLSTCACHNSIRAGRKLSTQEMNELLRQMEETPKSGLCNHGRPTYIKLTKQDLDRLFHRT